MIGEAGVNHDGDVEKACRLVRVAAEAGADAVKFQTFHPDRLVTRDAPKAAYQERATGTGESQHEMLARLMLDESTHAALVALCQDLGIAFMSTPFDEQSADFLESLGVNTFKIGSGDLTHLPLLAHVARKRLPMIVSTGMASLGQVEEALRTIRGHGNPPVTLLHCVSDYPASPDDVNLRAMDTLAAAFGVPVGYSDHTRGIEVALAAVARGARVIEKHFTLNRESSGPDHAASADPEELKALVRGVRIIERSLGHGRKEPTRAEQETAKVARRSIVVTCPVQRGAVLDETSLGIRRPGTGLPPSMLPFVIGRTARHDLETGTVLSLEDLS